MDSYQKLPKRKFIGARTEGVVYAQYVDEWRQKIERIGTAQLSRTRRSAQGIFGSLLVTVAIRADGSVEKVEIDRSSGHERARRAAAAHRAAGRAVLAVSAGDPQGVRHPVASRAPGRSPAPTSW